MTKSLPVRHVWSALCSLSSIDADTKNISLFNLIEKLSVNVPAAEWEQLQKQGGKGILLQYEFEIASRFYVLRNEASSFDLRFRFLDPDENELAASEQRIAVKEGIKNLRVRTKFSSVPIVKSGDCWLVVEVKGVDEDGYAEVQRLPLETVVKTDI